MFKEGLLSTYFKTRISPCSWPMHVTDRLDAKTAADIVKAMVCDLNSVQGAILFQNPMVNLFEIENYKI